ncbi:MAG: hypothetical protein IPK32_23890 [Verrucomicrobiaceae bacterium]|nr:hypothetical protein [Verrucomicrobiaceae bacterium]
MARAWSLTASWVRESRLVDSGALQEFNDMCRAVLEVEVMPEQDPIFHDAERLRNCIDLVFRPLVQSLAKYVTALAWTSSRSSGKPSELPQVKALLEDSPRAAPARASGENYPAGD